MSFTFGFYNSIEKDRLYDAIQVSKIFDGIIVDGVYNTVGEAFIVQASEEPNLVIVGPGRAWFNHTWSENDGYLEIELEEPETVVDRIDALVIDVDERVSVRANQLLVVKGTPSSTPQKPAMLHEPEHNQYPLAYITRKAATPVISQAQIENAVGSSECPFVTGVLEGLDVDLMLLQWRTAWTEFIAACQAHIDEWENAAKEDVAIFIRAFKDQMDAWESTQKEDFQKFYNEFKTGAIIYEQEYIQWVDHLKDILEEDALGSLLLEMEQIKEDIEKQVANTRDYLNELISGFQSKKTQFLEDGSIVETYPDNSTITTEFLSNGNIQETLKASNGVVGAVKLTEFLENGDIVESVVGGNYPEFALSKSSGVGEYINTTYNLGNDAFNNLQSIRDVANSELMMTAIVESTEAWEGLSKSPTAMNAFMSSDISLNVFTKHDSAMKTIIVDQWAKVEKTDILTNAIVESRTLLKFIFDGETTQKNFMDNPVLLTKLKGSSLKSVYIVASPSENPLTIATYNNTDHPEMLLKNFTYAIGFELYFDGRNEVEAGAYTATTTLYPVGEAGDHRKFIQDLSDSVPVTNMIFKIANAFTYCSITPDRTGALMLMQMVAF